tara:strand:+ start:124 stop:630 length:507 start_codon:yes stop_codon:yes gene_type:complete
MTNSVNLYLASGVYEDVGFWLVDFTEEDDIINSLDSKLLEYYRKELFGIEAAIEVKEAINSTLDILVLESSITCYKLVDSNKVYSSEIPLNIIEDIFDLWAYNYHDQILWNKYIGLLKFRRKIKKRNNYINVGLKGKIYEFALKLDKLLTFKPYNTSFGIDKTNELMW